MLIWVFDSWGYLSCFSPHASESAVDPSGIKFWPQNNFASTYDAYYQHVFLNYDVHVYIKIENMASH